MRRVVSSSIVVSSRKGRIHLKDLVWVRNPASLSRFDQRCIRRHETVGLTTSKNDTYDDSRLVKQIFEKFNSVLLVSCKKLPVDIPGAALWDWPEPPLEPNFPGTLVLRNCGIFLRWYQGESIAWCVTKHEIPLARSSSNNYNRDVGCARRQYVGMFVAQKYALVGTRLEFSSGHQTLMNHGHLGEVAWLCM